MIIRTREGVRLEVDDKASDEEIGIKIDEYYAKNLPEFRPISGKKEPTIRPDKSNFIEDALPYAAAIGKGAARGIAGMIDIGPMAVNLAQFAEQSITGKQQEFLPLPASSLVEKMPWPGTEKEQHPLIESAMAGLTGGALFGPVAAAAGAGAGTGAEFASQMGLPFPLQVAAGIGGGALGVRLSPKSLMPKRAISSLGKDIEAKGIQGTVAREQLASRLTTAAQKSKAQVDYAFAEVRKSGEAAIASKDSKNIVFQLSKENMQGGLKDTAKSVYGGTAKDLIELQKKGFVTIDELQTLRTNLSDQTRGLDRPAARAAGKAIGLIDDAQNEAFLKNTVLGDKKAISAWQSAIAKRKEHAVKFEDPEAVAKALKPGQTIEDIESALLGGTGEIANAKHVSQIYDDVQKAFKSGFEKDRAGFYMRQSIFNRMVKQSIKTGTVDEIRSATMSDQLRKLRTTSLWQKFPMREKTVLQRLENDLREAAKPGFFKSMKRGLQGFIRHGATRYRVEIPDIRLFDKTINIDNLMELMDTMPTSELPSRFGKGFGIGLTQQKETEQ